MLRVEPGTSPTPFLPPAPFRATWEGFVNVKLREEYRFSLEGRGIVQLSIDGKVILDAKGDDLSPNTSAWVTLQKGKNAIKVVYDSPEKGDAIVRLNWQTKDAPAEAVNPEAFTHDTTDPSLLEHRAIRKGRELIAQYRCFKCHAAPDVIANEKSMPELQADTPNLADVGARLRESWLARWVHDPHAIRADTPMPRLFPKPADDKEDLPGAEARDIAAFLSTLGKTEDQQEPEADEQTIGAGGRLFAGLGCIACHNFDHTDKATGANRISLEYVKAKFKPGVLKRFILNPQEHFAWIQMPNPRLSDEEAQKIVPFILSRSQSDFPIPEGKQPNAQTGKNLVSSSGCLNCHTLKLDNGFKPPTWSDVLKSDMQSGCLATGPKSRKTAPDLALDPSQRAALQAAMKTNLAQFNRDSQAEFAERQVTNLRCTACHNRDGREETWGTLADEIQQLEATLPGQPDQREDLVPDQFRPQLTWIGEKLNQPWMESFIAGQIKYKPRPWIYARMPAFPTHAKALAQGLALQQACSPTSPATPKPDDKIIDAGRQLVGKEAGFSCISCHGVGDLKPVGASETVGINFLYVKERIRHDYYTRWMQDPQRVEPGTRMPRFGNIDGTSDLKTILDGDLKKQIQSIWDYLQTAPNLPTPNSKAVYMEGEAGEAPAEPPT